MKYKLIKIFKIKANKDSTFKAKAKAKDPTFKAKAKAKDSTFKAKAKAKDFRCVLKDSSRPRSKAKDNNTGFPHLCQHLFSFSYLYILSRAKQKVNKLNLSRSFKYSADSSKFCLVGRIAAMLHME